MLHILAGAVHPASVARTVTFLASCGLDIRFSTSADKNSPRIFVRAGSSSFSKRGVKYEKIGVRRAGEYKPLWTINFVPKGLLMLAPRLCSSAPLHGPMQFVVLHEFMHALDHVFFGNGMTLGTRTGITSTAPEKVSEAFKKLQIRLGATERSKSWASLASDCEQIASELMERDFLIKCLKETSLRDLMHTRKLLLEVASLGRYNSRADELFADALVAFLIHSYEAQWDYDGFQSLSDAWQAEMNGHLVTICDAVERLPIEIAHTAGLSSWSSISAQTMAAGLTVSFSHDEMIDIAKFAEVLWAWMIESDWSLARATGLRYWG